MSLSGISYVERAKKSGYLLYDVAEADAEGKILTETVTPSNPMQNCYSVAKAFAALAFGICVDRGLLTPETRLADLFPEAVALASSEDEKWRQVTLDHCLCHRIGYGNGCLDIDVENASEWGTPDYLSLALSQKLVFRPGEKRVYSDAAYYLVSRAITEVTGETLLDFIRPILMRDMHFRDVAWSVCPMGYSIGATGLFLHTSDMVKLGVLWLRSGDWFGKRIVSEGWIRTCIERGYDCYRLSEADGGWYGKGGMNGQMVAFNPTVGRAIAWHGYQSGPDFERIVK